MAADQNVPSVDPKLYVVTIGGVPIGGFAEGSMITVEGADEAFTKRKGGDGSVDRINNNANDYMITLRLMQTSISNDYLSGIHIADKASSAGKLPMGIADLSGRSVFAAEQAWVKGFPSKDHGDALGSVDWVIETGPATNFIGGN